MSTAEQRFTFSDEQEQFRDVVRRFLQETSPTTEVRRLMATDSGFDQTVWTRISEELGLPAVHIPEAYGGQGFGFAELGLVLEEMGRVLFCGPYFSSTVLGASAILNGASEDEKAELLPPIAAGNCIATLAVSEQDGKTDAASIATTATATADGFTINGAKHFVLDGSLADLIIVVAREEGSAADQGLSLFAVDGNATGLDRQLLATMDATRKQSRLTFDSTPARLLGDRGAAADSLEKTIDQATIALANEMIGGAQYLLDSAVAYTQQRMQFGRAIGSFQAIKHRCADMLLDVELAKSAAYYAAAAAAEDDPSLGALASLAKAAASDAYLQAAITCVQLHGGIGFTWDNDTQLWFKRAKSSEVLLGDANYHRERMMQRWGEDL